MRNITFLFLLLILFSQCADKNTQVSFEGEWEWEKEFPDKTFSIDIQLDNDQYQGRYCAVAESGNRIDCATDMDDHSFTFFKSDKSPVIVDFVSNYSLERGKAKLELQNNTLLWEIVERPHGMYFCPNKAVLIKE